MSSLRSFSTLVHKDGASQAYEVLGSEHIGRRTPLALVNGMSMLRGDWQRLADTLSQFRPILIFDHRGMGDSTFSTQGTEQVTLESMARDLLELLVHLNWQEIAICGYSMGGAITQQLLFLPYHPTNPTGLPFRTTHVFLTATLCQKQNDNSFARRFKETPPPVNGTRRTLEKKRELARPTAEAVFDPTWIAANPARFDWVLNQMTFGRPVRTILMQARTLGKIDFQKLHDRLPRDTKILVIHGTLDAVLPYASSREILKSIPWAKDVEVGNEPGQIPSLAFGHQWFEYFAISVWSDVFEVFLKDSSNMHLSRL